MAVALPAPGPAGDACARLDAAAHRAGVPLSAHVQVTARCSYRCVHCYQLRDHAGELTLAELDRILGELADAGTLFLALTGGEVLLRDDADAILRTARRRGFLVKLLTSGALLDERRADLIRALGGVQVDLSVYAADAAVHDGVTGVPGSWARTLAAARRLRARGVTVVLKSPAMSMNGAGLGAVAALAADLGCAHSFDPVVTCREDGDPAPTRLRLDDAGLRAFYAGEDTGVLHEVARTCHRSVADSDRPCRAGQDMVAIGPRGQVYPCASLSWPCGDLRAERFADIWRDSPVLARLRALTWEHISPCNRCDLRAACPRCHAAAELEDGDVAGRSREACRHALAMQAALRERGLTRSTAVPPGWLSPEDGLHGSPLPSAKRA